MSNLLNSKLAQKMEAKTLIKKFMKMNSELALKTNIWIGALMTYKKSWSKSASLKHTRACGRNYSRR